MRNTASCRILVLVLLAGLSSVSLPAGESNEAAYWPQFHGPNGNNISPDTDLLEKWPEEGPPLVWQFGECGDGYSGVSLAEGRIFTAGDFGDEERILALSIDGKRLWTSANGTSWNGPYPGSRTTPTWQDRVLYQLNPNGRLAAYRAEDGTELWSLDLVKQFGAQPGTWAMAENVAVVDGLVLCAAGGRDAYVVALDKRSGQTTWVNRDRQERAAYGSPIVVNYGGRRQYIVLTQQSVISLDVKTGELLWRYPHETKNDQNTVQPVYRDGFLFVTSGHLGGGTLLKINADARGVTPVWYKKEYDNCHGGVILVEGRIYGSGCRSGGRGFFCADFLSGELKQSDRELGKVSLTFADGRLYAVSVEGRLSLLRPTAAGFEIASHFDLPKRGDDLFLAHPVIVGGRLYIRHGKNLYAYDLRKAAGA